MYKKQIKYITEESFKNYGDVIELKPHSEDGWEIVVRVENTGWRIAVLEFARRTTKKLERHPTSKESFEPLLGTALLIAALKDFPEDFEVFLLDRPVCLNAGVWHQVISLSDLSQVKITENLVVSSEFYELENEIGSFVM